MMVVEQSLIDHCMDTLVKSERWLPLAWRSKSPTASTADAMDENPPDTPQSEALPSYSATGAECRSPAPTVQPAGAAPSTPASSVRSLTEAVLSGQRQDSGAPYFPASSATDSLPADCTAENSASSSIGSSNASSATDPNAADQPLDTIQRLLLRRDHRLRRQHVLPARLPAGDYSGVNLSSSDWAWKPPKTDTSADWRGLEVVNRPAKAADVKLSGASDQDANSKNKQ